MIIAGDGITGIGTESGSGTSGIDGTSGTSGIDGTSGTSGEQGERGDPGMEGEQGIPGMEGPPGADGPSGADGTSGTSGINGEEGPVGPEGEQGIPGMEGPPGADGLPGADGTSGTSALADFSPSISSDHTSDGVTASVTVNTNSVGFGCLFYHTASGMTEADADTVGTMPCVAMAMETGTGTKNVLLKGFVRDDSWSWTAGDQLYVSTTAGGITTTQPSGTGDQVQLVGWAYSATVIWFDPNGVIVEVS